MGQQGIEDRTGRQSLLAMLLLCRSKQPPRIEHPGGLAAKLSLVPERRIYCFATGAGMICTLLRHNRSAPLNKRKKGRPAGSFMSSRV